MITTKTLQDNLRAWILTVLSQTNPITSQPYINELNGVVFADEDGNRPGLPYLTLKINASVPVGVWHRSKINASGIRTLLQNTSLLVELNSFGKESRNYLEVIKIAFAKDDFLELLKTYKMAARTTEVAIQDITLKLDEHTEHRWIYEPQLGFTQIENETVGIIEFFTLNPTFTQPT